MLSIVDVITKTLTKQTIENRLVIMKEKQLKTVGRACSVSRAGEKRTVKWAKSRSIITCKDVVSQCNFQPYFIFQVLVCLINIY